MRRYLLGLGILVAGLAAGWFISNVLPHLLYLALGR